MQLHLEGTEELSLQREKVFGLLTDPSFLARSLPDAKDVTVAQDGTVNAKVKVGISLVTANMQMKMRVEDKIPTQHARLVVEGSGSGSNMKIASDFDLEGDGPTKMKWSANAEITGIMAGIGSTIIKGFAEKKVTEIFQGIKRAMESA